MSKRRSPITTHVLDISRGRPGVNIGVTLERKERDEHWQVLARGKTNADGRIEDLLEPGSRAEAGTYRLTFDTHGTGFYPHVTIAFEVKNPDEHYHVPLLLSPFGFSTYRGT